MYNGALSMTAKDTLHIIVWKWRDSGYKFSYTAEHVNTMASMLARNLNQPYSLICITDDPTGILCETAPIWTDFSDLKNTSMGFFPLPEEMQRSLPSCYRRLKIFSAETTRSLGIADGERVVSIDLDMVITANIDSLFLREENFVGWQEFGKEELRSLPEVRKNFNGSLWMFRAGSCEFLWTEFDPVRSPDEAHAAICPGSDQAWITYRMYDRVHENSPQWTGDDGVRRYSPNLQVYGTALMPGTRIAVFCGQFKPWMEESVAMSPWIKEYYW